MHQLNEQAPAAKAVRDSDSSHWYEWLPQDRKWLALHHHDSGYDLRDAKRDARAGRIILPSVTSYFKMLHKQQLLDWKVEQALLAAADNPFNSDVRFADETLDEWVDRIASKASGASRGAADLGTRIHKAIENAAIDLEYDADMDCYVQPVMAKRAELKLKSIGAEETVGSLEHGYAGTCDDRCEGMIIVDYKSRKTTPNKKAMTYETDAMQTAAYGVAEWGPAFFVQGGGAWVFVISTTEKGRVEPVHFTGDELREAFAGFVGLMALWRYVKNFDPRR